MMRVASDREHKGSGFTLLETLVAMMIIVGAIIIVTSSWSGNFTRIRKTALLQETSHLIEKKMTELDIKYRDHFSDIPETEHGDFGRDYKNYRWEMKSRDFEMPDISAVVAGQNQKGAGGADEMTVMLVKQMQDYIKTAVKEITLTVFVKTMRAKKEVPYSVTTYFVDYDKEMALPGMGAPAPGGASTPGGGHP